MSIFKLNLLFIWHVIRFNPIKIAIILSTILSARSFMISPKDTIIYQSISGPIYTKSDTLYLCQLIEDYKNIEKSETPQYKAITYSDSSTYIIRGNKIFDRETNDAIFWWLIFSLILLTLSFILASSIDDEDDTMNPNWEFDRNFRRSKAKFIDCEKEEDTYYYTVKDRLVHESSYILSDREVRRLDWSFSNLNYLPRFKTKRKWRDQSIKFLGI